MNSCLIISRFNEDISWLKKYENFDIIIYNKGKELKNSSFKNIYRLPNLGRESHTWLHHIVNNYDRLHEVNIFLQGKIDDLGCMAFQDPNDYILEIRKFGFSVSRYGLLGPFHWSDNIGIEKDKRYKKAWEDHKISRSEVGFRTFAKNLFPEIPILVSTSYGGCFAVTREVIKSNDLALYKYLLDILGKHQNPIEGHYMERLWCYLFTKNKPIYKSFLDVLITKFEKIYNSNNIKN